MAYELKANPPPFQHQLDEYLATREVPAWALFWEPGCAKTKPTIDSFGHLFCAGQITGVIVTSLKEVIRNWTRVDDLQPGELQRHLNVDSCPARWHLFENNGSSEEGLILKDLLVPSTERLKILAISASGLSVTGGRTEKLCRTFISKHRGRIMFVVDESSLMQSHTSKRTKRITTLMSLSAYRRELEGTPQGQTPLSLYSQIHALDPSIFPSMTAFKRQYAVTEPEYLGGGRVVEKIVSFKNLGHLQQQLQRVSSRKLKRDCFDLPKKIHLQPLLYEMSDEQRRIYNDVAARAQEILLASGEFLQVGSVLAQAMKLRQVASGFAINQNETTGVRTVETVTLDRVHLQVRATLAVEGKVIVWTSFRWSNLALAKAFAAAVGDDAVMSMNGGTPEEHRAGAVRRFQTDPAVKVLVAAQPVLQRGLTLTSCSHEDFFEPDWSAMQRVQCEDRIDRPGQTERPCYRDTLSEDRRAIDNRVRDVNRGGIDLANLVMGTGWQGLFERL